MKSSKKRKPQRFLNTCSIFNLQKNIYRNHVHDSYLAVILPEGSWQPKEGRPSYLCQYLTKGVLASVMCLEKHSFELTQSVCRLSKSAGAAPAPAAERENTQRSVAFSACRYRLDAKSTSL